MPDCQNKISVIVPAYNEEKYLADTLDNLVKCPLAEEIILVNDGSTDQTLKIARQFSPPIKIISYRQNHGKGYALVKGIQKAKGKLIVFLDAHLLNLKNRHLRLLVQPLAEKKAHHTLGIHEVLPQSLIKKPILAQLTGQRAYLRKDLLPHLSHIKTTRFGAETYLNQVFKNKLRATVYLQGLIHIRQYQRMPVVKVPHYIAREAYEIAKTKAKTKFDKTLQIAKNFLKA